MHKQGQKPQALRVWGEGGLGHDASRQSDRRCQAIEPIIGHLKADHRMDRCHLKESEGDEIHAVLCAAGYNIRWLLRMIVKKCLGLLMCLLKAGGLTGIWEKLAEIFGHHRLQNSDQRWVLA
jgi:IS5 family transposase